LLEDIYFSTELSWNEVNEETSNILVLKNVPGISFRLETTNQPFIACSEKMDPYPLQVFPLSDGTHQPLSGRSA
jgi:hypothetical protein